MGSWLWLVVGVLAGGVVAGSAWLVRTRRPSRPDRTAGSQPAAVVEQSPVPPGVAAVLAVLRSSAVVVDRADVVVKASSPAYELGLVRGDRLAEAELATLVRQVRRDGMIRESELVLNRSRGIPQGHVHARVAPLGSHLVLVLAEDRTRERRLESVRRDFAVNVSHELKTPVGALSLLAEAVGEASDDPEAVDRFARRMRVEADRLGRLVQQVVELSRLQDDELLEKPDRVDVDGLVHGALDRSRIDAESRHVDLVGDHGGGMAVRGNPGQLAVALGNLVDNAVAYSPDGTRVAVIARAVGGMVHLTVSDQGVGIAEDELERIFERFYRVDPARARSTGGTGLGLSIVKHVAASHGGEVRVWSQEGTGSSFTLVLPAWTGSTVGEAAAGSAAQEPSADAVPTPILEASS